MKFFLFLFILPLVCLDINAQKIKINEVDKFTKKCIIETSFEKINGGITSNLSYKNVWLAFRRIDNSEFLRIKWCCNAVVSVVKGAEVIFLDADGNTYSFENNEYEISDYGEGTVGFAGSGLLGLDLWLIGNCSVLEGKQIKAIRINTNDGYVDIEISKKASDKITKTYLVYKKAINHN